MSNCHLRIVRQSLFFRWFCSCGEESVNFSSLDTCREDAGYHLFRESNEQSPY